MFPVDDPDASGAAREAGTVFPLRLRIIPLRGTTDQSLNRRPARARYRSQERDQRWDRVRKRPSDVQKDDPVQFQLVLAADSGWKEPWGGEAATAALSLQDLRGHPVQAPGRERRADRDRRHRCLQPGHGRWRPIGCAQARCRRWAQRRCVPGSPTCRRRRFRPVHEPGWPARSASGPSGPSGRSRVWARPVLQTVAQVAHHGLEHVRRQQPGVRVVA